MRLLFSKSASPHHGFAAYYTYIEKVFKARRRLHFGTHGSLEFMPGKQVGMSGVCYPDSLDRFHAEHLLLRREQPFGGDHRQATLVRQHHLLPHPAGRERWLVQGIKGTQGINCLVPNFEGFRPWPVHREHHHLPRQSRATWTRTSRSSRAADADAAEFEQEFRDLIVGKVYGKIMEIESRLLPCGLHVVGCPPSAEEAVATLVNIAGIDREEDGIIGMPQLLAQAIGEDIENIYRRNDAGESGIRPNVARHHRLRPEIASVRLSRTRLTRLEESRLTRSANSAKCLAMPPSRCRGAMP